MSDRISLVAMPWATLEMPSIQIGVLAADLEQHGFEVRSHSFFVTAAECFAEAGIGTATYQAVAKHGWRAGLGDWIFSSSANEGEFLALLRDSGLDDKLMDAACRLPALAPLLLERCAEELLEADPAIVGFTTSFAQNLSSLALARMLKQRRPSIAIVFGGANCDGPMGAALHRLYDCIDVVVRGEAEPVLPQLCRELLAGGAVTPQPGLCYRDGATSVAVPMGATRTPADQLAIPDYHEFFQRIQRSPLRNDILPEVRLPIETSRGCWWGRKMHCTFCGLNGSSMVYASKSPQRAWDEVNELARRHARVDFEAVDNIIDMDYVREFLPLVANARREGQDFTFFYETKANLTHEQVRGMRDAGVNRIQPGIETLSSPILRLMRKGATAMQNIRLLKWAARYGIQVTWNIIYGFPGEPPDEYQRMAELVPSLVHLKPPALVRLLLQRFSPYHQDPAAWGIRVTGPVPSYRLAYGLSESDLMEVAYDFTFDYADGRDPESYVQPLRDAVGLWDDSWRANGFRSLRYTRGPGFLRIRDLRPGLAKRDYLLSELEAEIYLRCESGATPRAIQASLAAEEIADVEADAIRVFLDSLTSMRLLYAEEGRYLSLALPSNSEAEVRNSTAPATVELCLTSKNS
jgi:ribosomal peptide maturation radical SAM protein 1